MLFFLVKTQDTLFAIIYGAQERASHDCFMLFGKYHIGVMLNASCDG